MKRFCLRGLPVMELPFAPTSGEVKLRGDYADAAEDYTVSQQYQNYTAEDQSVWRELWQRQIKLLQTHATPEFIAGVDLVGAGPEAIPRFEVASEALRKRTGWEIVAVPGLIPEREFFAHLAARHFPVTVWIRRRDELDYLVEPDLFHDFFGHVPLLAQPAFADFVQAYGQLGPVAARHDAYRVFARLYWYMVEFGLMQTPAGLRAYGAGMLSSAGETRYCLESPVPNRVAFNLERVLSTNYLIDAFQQTYFVIEHYEELFQAVLGADLDALFERLKLQPGHDPRIILPSDRVISRGSLAQPPAH